MILMLNCSYKGKNANTLYFFELLKRELDNCTEKSLEIIQIKDVLQGQLDEFASRLQMADALVIGAPLYVDGLPAQAVKLLELVLENHKGEFPNLPVYVVSNLGFYEAGQIKNLLAIVENWCMRMGMNYGGGLAIGGGPMVRAVEKMPLKNFLLKDVADGFEKLAGAIASGNRMENYYTKTRIPRGLYLKAAHMTFDQTAKANGLKAEDIR